MDDLPLSSVHAHRRIIFIYPRFRWAMLQRRFCPQALSEERAAEFFGAVCQLVYRSDLGLRSIKSHAPAFVVASCAAGL